MLLSLVASHRMSVVIPLVGRLALLGGSLSPGSSMHNSLLVWVLRVDLSGLCCWLFPYSSRVSPRPSRRLCAPFYGEIHSPLFPWVGGDSSSPFRFRGHSPPSLLGGDTSSSTRAGDVEYPFLPGEGGPSADNRFPPSSSLPLDTRGGVGPPTPCGVGGPLEGIIMCHPPPRRGMTDVRWFVGGLCEVDCGFLVSFRQSRRRPWL